MARILVIEDEEKIRRILAISLGLEGHIVETSSLGEEGLQKIGSFNPQVLILDYKLPDYEGGKIIAKVRSYSRLRNLPALPIILLTGLDPGEINLGEEPIQEVYLLPKPFENQELIKLIERILSS